MIVRLIFSHIFHIFKFERICKQASKEQSIYIMIIHIIITKINNWVKIFEDDCARKYINRKKVRKKEPGEVRTFARHEQATLMNYLFYTFILAHFLKHAELTLSSSHSSSRRVRRFYLLCGRILDYWVLQEISIRILVYFKR
jgi:hypothetical protein